MAPIRRTSRAQPNSVNTSLELTSIHNSLQITQQTIRRMQTNSKVTFTTADLDKLTTIYTAVFSVQNDVAQLSRSIGKNIPHSPKSTVQDLRPINTSHIQTITPRRALINKIYNRSPKKDICWYHKRHGDATDPRNCDGSCGYVSPLVSKNRKPTQNVLCQIQNNKENIIPDDAIQSIPVPVPADMQSIPILTSAQPTTMDWPAMCDAEENQLLADDGTTDLLTKAMLKADLRTELESVSD